MKDMRKAMMGLIVATGLGLSSAMVYAQAVITPYSPNEAGPAPTQQEEATLENGVSEGTSAEACVTPYSPNECGPAEARTGGTVAPELGGTLGSSSLGRLPETPGPHPEDQVGEPE